jgi:hypothetical protein
MPIPYLVQQIDYLPVTSKCTVLFMKMQSVSVVSKLLLFTRHIEHILPNFSRVTLSWLPTLAFEESLAYRYCQAIGQRNDIDHRHRATGGSKWRRSARLRRPIEAVA